jgi:putative nucleotidyltransferase with HDIG domain
MQIKSSRRHESASAPARQWLNEVASNPVRNHDWQAMNRRILFVEDNAILRQVYAMMLQGDEQAWEITTAASGEEALQLMASATFDIIVSDMRMPGMDGVQLIHEVKQHYPRTSRIILSGLSDQREIAECLGETHQFIAKPFDAKTMKATLNRLGALDSYLQEEKLQSLAGRLGTLPSFPSLYFQIMQELATEDPSVENIARIVSQDPGMTAKMLQIANSAAFGLGRRVGSPFEAVQYVGTGTVRSLALSAHVFSAFEKIQVKDFSIARLWDHAMRTALLARAILRQTGAELSDQDDAYTAGMLHDIGKMMLAANVPDQFQLAVDRARERHLPLHEAEPEVFGATHAGVGAYLLGLWGLPAAIVEAVAFHHTPQRSDGLKLGALGAVHVASSLEHERHGDEPAAPPASLDTHYLSRISAQDQLDSWRSLAAKLFQPPDD